MTKRYDRVDDDPTGSGTADGLAASGETAVTGVNDDGKGKTGDDGGGAEKRETHGRNLFWRSEGNATRTRVYVCTRTAHTSGTENGGQHIPNTMSDGSPLSSAVAIRRRNSNNK